MNNIINSIYNIGFLDELSKKDTFIHRIHPIIKVIITLLYLVFVLSFGRYEISKLITFVFYPILIFSLAEIPVVPILKRVVIALPFILGIGIVNLFFDKEIIMVGGLAIRSGYITFTSIFIKCLLTVTASILLIATTGMERLGLALRMMKIPKIFVLQLLLTYRYISLFMEEVSTMSRTYALRAPNENGIGFKAWGSFAGQLLLRTYDKATRIYESMTLRGFNGEYNTGDIEKLKYKDYVYMILWSLFFIVAKFRDIPNLIGNLF